MNRTEFMTTLRKRLECLPSDERESALNYYEEFFEDAGQENQQNVISNLGSPDELADTILKSSGYFIETKGEKDINNNAFEYNKTDKQSNEKINSNPQDEPIRPTDNKKNTKWIVILIIIATFPFWIGVVGAAFGILVAAVSVLFALLICSVVVPLACIIGGIFMIPQSPLLALFLIGIALLTAGIFLLLIPLAKCVIKGIGYCFKGIGRFFKSLFSNKEVN